MADPNSALVNVAAATAIIIPAPTAPTTLQPPPPYALGFIRVLGIELTGTATSLVTIFSSGGSFPDRTLSIVQMSAGGGEVRQGNAPGSGGIYDCDPGANLKITNSAGVVTGSIRYCIMGVG